MGQVCYKYYDAFGAEMQTKQDPAPELGHGLRVNSLRVVGVPHAEIKLVQNGPAGVRGGG